MKQNTRKITEEDIEQKATEALNMLGQIMYPIDVLKIARAYDLEVFSDTNFRKDESGFIALSDFGKYEITLNEDDSIVKKRFALAHQIAHFLFNKEYINQHKSIDKDSNIQDETYRSRKKIADKFALCLLMPQQEFINVFLETQSIKETAAYFLVSKTVAIIRASHVGLGVL